MESVNIEPQPRWTILLVAAALTLFWVQAAWADEGLARVAEVLGQVIKGADCSPNCKAPPKPRATLMGHDLTGELQNADRRLVERLFQKADRPVTAAGLLGIWKWVLLVEEKDWEPRLGIQGRLHPGGLGRPEGLCVSRGLHSPLAFANCHLAAVPSQRWVSDEMNSDIPRASLRARSVSVEAKGIDEETGESVRSRTECRLHSRDELLCRLEQIRTRPGAGASRRVVEYVGYSRVANTAP